MIDEAYSDRAYAPVPDSNLIGTASAVKVDVWLLDSSCGSETMADPAIYTAGDVSASGVEDEGNDETIDDGVESAERLATESGRAGALWVTRAGEGLARGPDMARALERRRKFGERGGGGVDCGLTSEVPEAFIKVRVPL